VEGKPIRFAQLLELHIVNQINKKFAQAVVDNTTLHGMRDMIREQVHGIFKKSTHSVTEEGLNWVANQLFRNITLGTTDGTKKPINELVIMNEYKISDLPYSDIQLLRNLFNETRMGPELEAEYKRRSAA